MKTGAPSSLYTGFRFNCHANSGTQNLLCCCFRPTAGSDRRLRIPIISQATKVELDRVSHRLRLGLHVTDEEVVYAVSLALDAAGRLA